MSSAISVLPEFELLQLNTSSSPACQGQRGLSAAGRGPFEDMLAGSRDLQAVAHAGRETGNEAVRKGVKKADGRRPQTGQKRSGEDDLWEESAAASHLEAVYTPGSQPLVHSQKLGVVEIAATNMLILITPGKTTTGSASNPSTQPVLTGLSASPPQPPAILLGSFGGQPSTRPKPQAGGQAELNQPAQLSAADAGKLSMEQTIEPEPGSKQRMAKMQYISADDKHTISSSQSALKQAVSANELDGGQETFSNKLQQGSGGAGDTSTQDANAKYQGGSLPWRHMTNDDCSDALQAAKADSNLSTAQRINGRRDNGDRQTEHWPGSGARTSPFGQYHHVVQDGQTELQLSRGQRVHDSQGKAAAVSSRITAEFVSRAELLRREGKLEFHLHLEPPELGTVRIQVIATQNGLAARFMVSQEGTRQLIEAGLQQLAGQLTQAGIDIRHFDVSSDGSRYDNSDSISEPTTSPARSRARRTHSPVALSGVFYSPSRVDVLA